MRAGPPAAAARGIWAALGIAQGSPQQLRIMGDGVAEIRASSAPDGCTVVTVQPRF
jgi:hypothetical protein